MSDRSQMLASSYLRQLNAAEREMRRFYDDLKATGWTRSVAGVWTHPEHPGTEIMEG